MNRCFPALSEKALQMQQRAAIYLHPRSEHDLSDSEGSRAGKRCSFVYGCYAGDNLNFDMGEEFLNDDGIQTAHVRVWDDVASAPQERIEDRRESQEMYLL